MRAYWYSDIIYVTTYLLLPLVSLALRLAVS